VLFKIHIVPKSPADPNGELTVLPGFVGGMPGGDVEDEEKSRRGGECGGRDMGYGPVVTIVLAVLRLRQHATTSYLFRALY